MTENRKFSLQIGNQPFAEISSATAQIKSDYAYASRKMENFHNG